MTNPNDTGKLGATRHHAMVEKWENGRTPDDGEPDAIDTAVVWHEADGSLVTDPDRLDDLNKRHAELYPHLPQ